MGNDLPWKTPFRRSFDDMDRLDNFKNLDFGDKKLAKKEIRKKR
jgi:hypothetical protein